MKNLHSGDAPVVTAVTSGALRVPANGVVTLPAQWSALTPRGTINVERRPDGRLFILFPTFYGRGQDVDGWLYGSGPLTAADFYLVDWGPGGKHSELDACGYKMLSVDSKLRVGISSRVASTYYVIASKLASSHGLRQGGSRYQDRSIYRRNDGGVERPQTAGNVDPADATITDLSPVMCSGEQSESTARAAVLVTGLYP